MTHEERLRRQAESARRFARANPEVIQERRRRYKEKYPEADKLRQLAYREKFPERYAAQRLNWETANPERHAAKVALRRAVERGAVQKHPCMVCGDAKSEAHHASYAPDMWLFVVWLCRAHHKQAHKEARVSAAL